MLRIGTVVVGVDDFRRAVGFWTAALDYEPRDPIGEGDDYVVLVPAAGTGAHLALDTSQSPVEEVPRVHLDLYAADAAEQAQEVERLLALGATAVDWPHYPPNPDFVVLADPEGNRFCVIDANQGASG